MVIAVPKVAGACAACLGAKTNSRTMTFLALDVGNTRLKWGLYDSPAPGAKLLGSGAVFLENIDRLADEDWRELPEPTHMLGCIVAGEAIRRRVEEQMELWDITPHWAVSSAAEAGLTNGYDHPTRLGADRWVAMIGAHARMLHAHGSAPKPMVVVMVGTAVTVEAIDASGKFLGGLILPGHGIMLRALESGTAGLRVPTGEVCEFPTNTSDALTSGGTFAIAGAVERMVHHVRQHCGAEPACYMTGGAGWKMAPSMSVQFELVDSLIFDGLLEIAKQRLDHPTPLWPSRSLF
jgi:type III pantothenate kinase